MSGNDEKWDRGVADFDQSRFLEYTHKALAERFKPLDDGVIAELKSFPALFAYEISEERSARLGWITDIRRRQNDLQIRFEIDPRYEPLEPAAMRKLLGELDIEPKLEIHRSHWAVKEVDLEGVLTSAGLLTSSRPSEQEEQFSFSRRTVLAACTMLKSISHSDLDGFILSLGIDAVEAGRNVGSRQARAAALGRYVVSNMGRSNSGG